MSNLKFTPNQDPLNNAIKSRRGDKPDSTTEEFTSLQLKGARFSSRKPRLNQNTSPVRQVFSVENVGRAVIAKSEEYTSKRVAKAGNRRRV